MAAKLVKTVIAFVFGFGLGVAAVLINGEFIIHIPVVLGIVASAIYLTKEQIWAFLT